MQGSLSLHMSPRMIDLVELIETGTPLRMLAVDPGERYVGHAQFYGDEVIDCGVRDPDSAVEGMWAQIENQQFDIVVAELWRNFGEQVTWSDCRTVEVIGALHHMCRRHGVPMARYPSFILRPGRARMKAHGLEMPDMSHISADLRNHAESATIHGYWWRFEQRLTSGQRAC